MTPTSLVSTTTRPGSRSGQLGTVDSPPPTGRCLFSHLYGNYVSPDTDVGCRLGVFSGEGSLSSPYGDLLDTEP